MHLITELILIKKQINYDRILQNHFYSLYIVNSC
jgi:hypothetical protein